MPDVVADHRLVTPYCRYKTQVQPAVFSGADTGDVRDPLGVGCLGGKVTSQVIPNPGRALLREGLTVPFALGETFRQRHIRRTGKASQQRSIMRYFTSTLSRRTPPLRLKIPFLLHPPLSRCGNGCVMGHDGCICPISVRFFGAGGRSGATAVLADCDRHRRPLVKTIPACTAYGLRQPNDLDVGRPSVSLLLRRGGRIRSGARIRRGAAHQRLALVRPALSPVQPKWGTALPSCGMDRR